MRPAQQVHTERGPGVDWRDAAAYAPLLDADRSLLAWEWLRRDCGYRIAAEARLRDGGGADRQEARAFGLVAFEDPRLGVPFARPLWRSQAHACVVRAHPRPALADGDSFDVERLREKASLVCTNDTEHLLLSNGFQAIRLDGPPRVFSAGPVVLSYEIAGIGSAERPLLALRRFLALLRTGSFSRALHPREARARRWILMLRASDALAAGADQRRIAQVLLSASARGERWRTREPSIRSQVQRLVRSARSMAAGGYRILLD